MVDARFEDGGERPLRLRAESPEDLTILSALLQDAVFTGQDLRWSRKARRLDLLLNRFRWEDAPVAERQSRAYERVRAILSIGDALSVASQGLEPGDKDSVLSLLSLDFTPGDDGTGVLVLTLSGDGAIRVAVECLDLGLTDVTRPYRAPSGKAPVHPED